MVLVSRDDFAAATLAAAGVSSSPASSQPTESESASAAAAAAAADPEHADLLQHVDLLKLWYFDVFAEPSGLPPDRGVEHVVTILPDALPPLPRMYRWAPSELQEVQRQVTDLLAKQLIEPPPSPYGDTYTLCGEEDW